MKSKRSNQLVEDHNEIFWGIKKHNVKLNLEKYVFGASFKTFLRFMVSQKGIKVNPEKI